MHAEDLWLGALSGALVVLSGALYALSFALAKLGPSRRLMHAAQLAYVVLVGCTIVLARVLGLDALWLFVVIAMLAGYGLAPIAVWRLCVGAHGDAKES